jgi:uncharacterized RDD family membrane protein YckC
MFCGTCGNAVGFITPPDDVSPPAAAPAAAPSAPPDAPPPPPLGLAPTPAPGAPQMPPPMPPPPGGYQPYRFQDPVTGAPTAEWWQRAVALLLDGLVWLIPGIVIYFVVWSITATTTDGVTTHSGIDFWIASLIAYLSYGLYYIPLNGSKRGQTVGKMALGIATKDESGHGPIGYGRAAARFAIVFVCGYFCFIFEILNYLWPLWDPRRQAWHDKVARSLVISVR